VRSVGSVLLTLDANRAELPNLVRVLAGADPQSPTPTVPRQRQRPALLRFVSRIPAARVPRAISRQTFSNNRRSNVWGVGVLSRSGAPRTLGQSWCSLLTAWFPGGATISCPWPELRPDPFYRMFPTFLDGKISRTL